MKFSTAAAATALVATTASALTINTPAALVQCQPVAITFGDGTPPYYVSVIPNGQTGAVPLVQFPEAQSSPITWTVNVTGGTNIGFQVVDSTGTPAYSTPMDVQSSGNSACLNGGSSGGASTPWNPAASGAGTFKGTAGGSAMRQDSHWGGRSHGRKLDRARFAALDCSATPPGLLDIPFAPPSHIATLTDHSGSASASSGGSSTSASAGGASASGGSPTSAASGAASSAAQPSGGAGLSKATNGGVVALFGLFAAALGVVL